MTPRLLQHWIRHQAERRPWAAAIVDHGARLTYEELETESNRLARLLRAARCRPGDRVALLSRKSPMAIVGLLGIYKADAIYVPLDPASPAGRLTKILESCQCHWLLASGAPEQLLDDLGHTDGGRRTLLVGSLDRGPFVSRERQPVFTRDDIDAYSSDPVPAGNGPHDPAHILFTSGSTGIPKGVVITHASVMHFVEWGVRRFGLTAEDRVSGHTPLHFDLSFFDLFGAAAAGAELHLVPPELNLLPNKLADFIREHQLTQWFSVPSVLNYMAKMDVVAFNDFPVLKRVFWGGDVFPTGALMYWMRRLPHAVFTNLYGPTETTIASSYYTVPECPVDAHAQIPIGTACDGEELLVLDAQLEPLAPGETGDLYIGGVGLARGYWGDPDRTAAAFLHHPRRPSEWIYRTGDLARVGDDGLVYFLGRSDSQIKSRGYRIELGEVETAVNAVTGIVEGVVVALSTDGFEGATICCAYVPAAGSDLSPAALRAELSRQLPPYMLPSRWLCLDELPVNANGKIDRRRLRDAFVARIDPHAAQTA